MRKGTTHLSKQGEVAFEAQQTHRDEYYWLTLLDGYGGAACGPVEETESEVEEAVAEEAVANPI
jgi:hypothetical protein